MSGIDRETAGQFAQLGVSISPTVDSDIAIHPANEAAVAAWIECQTTWRVIAGPMGTIYLGLDYPAVRLVLEDLDSPKRTFADLRHMERAAMPILNKRDD